MILVITQDPVVALKGPFLNKAHMQQHLPCVAHVGLGFQIGETMSFASDAIQKQQGSDRSGLLSAAFRIARQLTNNTYDISSSDIIRQGFSCRILGSSRKQRIRRSFILMDVNYLRHVGLLEHMEAWDRVSSAPVDPELLKSLEQPDACEAARSRWTPSGLAEQLRLLPVAALFPDLCSEVVEILQRWHRCFSLKTWSRIVKVTKGSAHQVPCVLKELNESAPVIAKVRKWVDSLPTDAPKACIVDLGAGFGFLSMFLAELLPPERVAKFFLLDMTYPNLGVGNSSGSTSIEHLHGWKIPMYTLKVDLKKKTTLNQLAARVFRAPVSEEDPRCAPVYACGIHLCNTLGIRAAQLFNENVDVRGFAFVPCCFPTSRHLTQDVIYQLGEHKFAAKDFLDAKKMPSNNDRFSRWAEHILEGIDPGSMGSKAIERHRLVRPRKGMFAQDIYIFAERPLEAPEEAQPKVHAAVDSTVDPNQRGSAVVIWAKYGHAGGRKRK